MRISFSSPGLLAPWLCFAFLCTVPCPGAAAGPAGNVLVVDSTSPLPGVFPSIQQAVDAAVNGDVILVKPGSYAGFFVNGKGIDVVGEDAHVDGSVRIFNLPLGERVLLSNLDVKGIGSTAIYGGYGLWAVDNEGRVRVQNCKLTGAKNANAPVNCMGWGDDSGWEGALISNSRNVSFARCTLKGGNGLTQNTSGGSGCWQKSAGGYGGHGVEAIDAHVALYDCSVSGGAGGYGGYGPSGEWAASGGHGYHASEGTLFASGSTFVGGDGGFFYDMLGFTVPGGAGGHGISMTATASATLLDNLAIGGAGGNQFNAIPGPDGLPVSGGAVLPLAGKQRSFASPVPQRESMAMPMRFEGEPFDTVLVLVGVGDQFLPLPALHGVLLTAAPLVLPMGNLDAGGSATTSYPLGPLSPSTLALTVPLQSAFIQADLGVYIGPPVHQVILDSSF